MKYLTSRNITIGMGICAGLMLLIAGGFILSGILMGVLTTLAIWLSFQKLPERMQRWALKNRFTVLLTDVVLTKLTVAVIVLIGTGPTVFAAIVTQMLLLGILLDLKSKEQRSSWKSTTPLLQETQLSAAA